MLLEQTLKSASLFASANIFMFTYDKWKSTQEKKLQRCNIRLALSIVPIFSVVDGNNIPTRFHLLFGLDFANSEKFQSSHKHLHMASYNTNADPLPDLKISHG